MEKSKLQGSVIGTPYSMFDDLRGGETRLTTIAAQDGHDYIVASNQGGGLQVVHAAGCRKCDSQSMVPQSMVHGNQTFTKAS